MRFDYHLRLHHTQTSTNGNSNANLRFDGIILTHKKGPVKGIYRESLTCVKWGVFIPTTCPLSSRGTSQECTQKEPFGAPYTPRAKRGFPGRTGAERQISKASQSLRCPGKASDENHRPSRRAIYTLRYAPRHKVRFILDRLLSRVNNCCTACSDLYSVVCKFADVFSKANRSSILKSDRLN